MKKFLKDIRKFINENDQIHYCIRLFSLMNVINRDNVANSPSMAIVKNNKCTGITLQAIWLVFVAAMLLVNGVAMAQVTVTGSVYGGGNLAPVGGSVAVTINQTGATVTGDVYGGGAKANTNNWDPEGYEEVTVTPDVSIVTGLYTELNGTYSEITAANTKAAENTTYYSKGKWVTTATNKTTIVTLTKGTVGGDVYGGGYGLDGVAANVYGAVTVTVEGGTAQNVFGCNNLTGSPQSTVEVNITNTSDDGVQNVYGGGNAAAYTAPEGNTNYPSVTLTNGIVKANVYGGGLGLTATVTGNPQVSQGGATVTSNIFGGGSEAPVIGNPTVTISGGSATNVYGGGDQALVTGNTTVTTSDGSVSNNLYGGGNLADVTGDVTVNIGGGTVTGDVYGGGAKAHTNKANWVSNTITNGYHEVTGLIVGSSPVTGLYTESGGNYTETTDETAQTGTTYYRYGSDKTTIVTLTGGTVGNAYGGGLGELGSNDDSDDDDTPAFVYGDVTVTVDGTAFTQGTGKGRVFGCNNLKGTPKGSVNVVVERTVRTDGGDHAYTTSTTNNYEIQAVYGGGNLAPYEPVNTTNQKTKVEVKGCSNSIEYVYGGGNSASVPETDVTIEGAFEINCVFGGGNGSDEGSPGANVTGDTNTTLYGGKIHSVFGGSNTLGTIGGNTNLIIPEVTDANGCPLQITEVYGAGRNADVDHDVIIEIGCLADGVESVYGGAYNADINGKVQLTITSGVLQNVFGGNNSGGTIKGPITVNIEETDNCKPIKITNLYGAGNEAHYPSEGNNVPVSNPSVTVNVKACTSIENIYGGGCNADVYGNTEVNINMVKGWWADKKYPSTATEAIPNTIGTIGNVYGGGQNGKVYYSNSTNKTHGNATVNIGTATSVGFVTEPIQYRPSTAPDTELTKNATTGLYDIPVEGAKIVGDVYGGGEGNATTVDGTAQVNLGATDVSYTPEVMGNIYGGSAFGAVNMAEVNLVKGTVAMNGTDTETGNVFGGGKGQNGDSSTNPVTPEYTAQVTGSTTVTLNNATVQNAIYGGCNTNGEVGTSGTAADATTATVTLKSGTVGSSSATDKSLLQTVFGGGLGSNTHTYGKTVVNVGEGTTDNTVIYGNVYGGSRNGSIGAVAVDLKAGTIHGNVYGGGYETTANTAYVTRATDAATTVDVTVEGAIFEITNDATDASIIKTGQVFGCNNVTGSPTGHVKVEVKSTAQNGTQAVDVAAVYGGGNQADYLPTTANDYAEVLINRTENGRLIVGKVFGGGNAAGIGSTGEGGVAAGAQVTLTDGDIKNGLYGGCNSSGTVSGAIAVNLNGGTVGASGTGNSADVFGGGYGHSTSTSGNIGITLNGTTIYGDLYGGSALGNVNGSTDHTTTLTISSNTLHGTIYGGGQGTGSGEDGKATSNGNVQIDYNIANDNLTGLYGGANVNGHVAGDIDVNIIANVGASGAGNSIDIFGGGLGASTTTDGDVTVTIDKPTGDGATAPAIYGDIYGGSSLGEVGASGKTAKVDFKNGTLNGTIFGGGKGQLADSSTTPATPAVSATVSGAAEVAVSAGSITGGVYGGCNTKGTVTGDITVGLNGGTIGTENARADVFGGGFGNETTTSGNIGVTLNGTTVYGDLYGGSAMGSVNGSTDHTTTLTISSNTLNGTIYGGGQGDVEGETGHSNVTATSNGNVTINYNTANTNLTGLYGGANINGNVAGNISVNVKANVGASGDGNSIDIFGGGLGAATGTDGNVTVTIDKPTGDGAVAPVIYGAIYGGSALGSVNDAVADLTKVDILSGDIHGNIYGGGLGDKASLGTGHSDVVAQVNGTVIVNIGATDGAATPTYSGDATIHGDVYGCNNTNGSPKGDVTVNIYQTAHTTTDVVGSTEYAIDNVFGGGRQADYSPVLDANEGTTSTKRATVHVHGCENTIEDVFGGGDAAAAYGVATIVDGGRFNRVFGGGNGEVTEANIGAGGTNLTVHGGKINTLFGGSNTSGTITGAMGITVDNEGPCSGEMDIDEFFCGNNLASIGTQKNPVDITATIGCGTKFGDVYGGCNQADIYGNVTLTIVGGEMNNVYGGSKGSSAKAANINGDVELNIYGGKINNNAYGGSNINGEITGKITVNMDWSQASTSCNSATDLHVRNVYGASNLATYTPTTPGNYPEVNIKHGTVSGSVFGGGKGDPNDASKGVVTSNPVVTIGDNVAEHSAVVTGNVYGGGDAAAVSGNASVTYGDNNANSTVANLFGGGNAAGVSGNTAVNMTAGKVTTAVYGGCNSEGTVGGTSTVTVTGGTLGAASTPASMDAIPQVLFGGGKGENTSITGKVTLNVGTKSNATPAVYAGTAAIYGNVYGGSENGEIHEADVNLYGNTIYGNVFGGGYETADGKKAATTVNVNLDGTKFDRTSDYTAQIFGCNNKVGTPEGHVTVHVYRTAAANSGDTYHVAAVYGGGNEADYEPTDAKLSTEVIIEGCSATKIQDVYGGGNAAAVPATEVWILGSDIIDNVYGGGNGVLGADHAAHVGFHRTTTGKTSYATGSGSGETNVKLVAGNINNVYGGSNSNGDIRVKANVTMPKLTDYTANHDTPASSSCCTKLTTKNVYGGGNAANMEGDVNIILECMPEDYVDAVYGGAQNASINGSVSLTVTSGKFGRVFGGNNTGGEIKGSITVNVYEEGCKPLKIGELYGGGNAAPYSIYGCDETGGQWKANKEGEGTLVFDQDANNRAAIQVNVYSCTSIGKIYGGGMGETAEVVGNTHVWVNMMKGLVNEDEQPLGKIGQVFGGGKSAKVTGDTRVDIGTVKVNKKKDNQTEVLQVGVKIENGTDYISPLSNTTMEIKATEAGVYGGGEKADVVGNTTLNIGTEDLTLKTTINGNIFGGGLGETTTVTGDVVVNIGKKTGNDTDGYIYAGYATITGDVYGGSAMGKVNTTDGISVNEGKSTKVNLYGGTVNGDLYGGGLGNDTYAADVWGPVTVTVKDGSANNVFGGNNTNGTPKQSVAVNIDGGEISQSVYGGGNLAITEVSPIVTITDGVIGTGIASLPAGQTAGAVYGNVYGGGKGSDGTGMTAINAVKAGLITGDTKILISGGEIKHNVYGGGAYGSVGTFTYDTDAKITGYTSGGKAEIYITGGSIGTNGNENGMVFGSSRGDVGATGEIHDKLAWVYDTHVAIGDTIATTTTTTAPLIKGSVYGGGENGHNYHSSYIRINGGTIGITEGEPIGSYTAGGASYPYRGNVYGGGCGTDKYDNDTKFNPLAGIVRGDATIRMTAGTVVHNMYGAGAMGSVGTETTGGKTTINISGGTIGVSGTVGDGNVFGAARGDADATSNQFALVRKETSVSVSGNALVKGNVYGGGELGCVGTYVFTNDMKNFYWTNEALETDKTTYTYNNTGVCNVNISGGTIGSGVEPSADGTYANGNVFGAGKGLEDTWWCEKAIAYKANVTITDGTIKGTVYGGGQVGRVETDAVVSIGTENELEGTGKPNITGNVFGAGAGVKTHGYSALVRGDAIVTVQGVAQVGGSVYGGGEIASVGRFTVVDGLPKHPDSGGNCTVTIQDKAKIGASGTGHNVFGACKGVTPAFVASGENRSKSMQLATNAPSDASLWSYYDPDHTYIWRYYPDEPAYLDFLETLALTSHPVVTIAEDATVNGSVFGGGERGITLGSVEVNMNGGTVAEDVYGGGSLANTNKGNWEASTNTWSEGKTSASYTTTVNLRGGTITHDAYGGGLGRKEYGTKGKTGYVSPIEAMVYGDVKVELNKIQNEDGTMKTSATGCVVDRVFGCNNLNGTPKGKVQVYVYATQSGDSDKSTISDKAAQGSGNYDVAAVYGGGNLAAYKPIDAYSTNDDIKKAARPEVYIDGCDLTSIKQVYGGGNAAPAPATYVEIDRAYEIDEAFGGGNGYDNYSLQEGNTKVWYQNPGANVGYYTYADYPKGTGQGSGSETDPYKAVEITKFSGGSENKANRLSTTDEDAIKLRYGSGVATLIIKGGTVHTAYGGSNSKGNVRTLLASSISSMFDDCPMDIGQSYGGGKNAYSDADAEIIADCAKGVKEMFGGSKDADFDGNVNMRITNGSSLKRVFGGNNTSGAVNGFINITIEEGGCEPIRIEELYAGGFLAPYSVYGYEKNTDGSYKTQKDVPYLDVDENGVTVTKYHDQRIPNESGTRLYPDPRINVVSATYIGNIFGGGYQAKLVGNPHVNVNMTTGFVNVTKTEKAEGDPEDPYEFIEDGKTYVYKDVAGNTYDKNKVSAPDAEKPTELIATTDVGTIGNIYGGGNMADIIGDTYVEIGTGKWVKLVKDDAGNYNEVEENLTRNAAHITGNVFGGGKGKADNFLCDKAMVGVVDSGSGSTNVTISNGTVDGTVYGGGEIGRVESNTKVTIGTEGDGNSKPEIKGNVYGAGKGLHTHGYSALVRGNTEVFVQGSAKVDSCVYGGGELASVGRYTLVNEENQSQYPGLEIGMPGSFANNGSGKCVVKVRDNAVIGLDNMQMTATGGPDDAGHVFGAGKGAVPKVYSYNINDKETMPRRMMSYTSDLYKADKENITWEYSDAEKKNVWEYFDTEAKYITFIETMALATETEVTVSGKSFVKGSVYGGSENGFVQHGTEVTIEGGQIGAGENMSTPYDNDQFVNPVSTSVTTANALKPCAHWDYEDNGATYDRFAGTSGYDSKGGATTAKDGHTFYGNVFGGGSGYYPYAPGKWHHKAGSVGGNTVVTITGGHILSNVYGGNEQTDVGTYSHGANDEPILADGGKCTINMSGGTIGVPRDDESIAKLPTVGHLYGAGKGDKRILFNTWTNVGSTDVNVSGGIIYGNVYGGGEDGHVTNLAKMTVSEADPTNKPTIIGTSGTSGFDGDVFGGGQGSVTALTAGVVGGDVNLKVEGGNIKGSVYGGGRLASVGTYFAMAKIPDPNDKTKEIDNPNYGRMQDGDDHGIIIVSLTGGTVNKNVFGGCMGSTTNDALGVSKNVTVNLNGFETKTGETTTTTIVDDNKKGCVVKGSVFGCNNLNSSPLGSVLVHVFGTQKDGASQIANTSGDKTAKTPATKKADGDYDLSTFDVKAVYGGGNLAAYKPQGPGANLETYDYENTTHYAEVIIDGCERTSIGQVYGGGNAASTPATKVTVNGSYEIGEVFGGGNGKDKITINNVEKDNPGANVGFYDYSAVEATYDTKDKRQQDAFKSKYVYGTGKAAVNIFGGTIHRVFGGSNTKGNVRQSAITMLEEVGGCEFCVDEAYGGGKSAPMDAEAKLLMSCIPGLKEVYGGAQAADVYDNVSVTITNGTFNRVFGGNNLSGTIRGSITVNVEETGCRPVIIGELYGGGNLAGYSVYGYDVDNNGNVTLKQSGDSHWNHPQVNAKAFTSIGSIFGGGYGTNAVMVGDPTVNINVAEGDKKDYTYDNDKSTYKNANDEDVPYYDENGFKELTLTIDGHDVTLPAHAKGKIGAVNNVFGGGNAAKVIGNTNVNVGTEAEVYMVKEVKAGDSVSGLYTRTGEGTTTSPYVYSATESTAVAVDGTTYYVKKTVLGADIRGNVYGGGNAADVTGKTNVVIGKKIDE